MELIVFGFCFDFINCRNKEDIHVNSSLFFSSGVQMVELCQGRTIFSWHFFKSAQSSFPLLPLLKSWHSVGSFQTTVIIKKMSKRYAVACSRWAWRYPNLDLLKMSFSETEAEETNLQWNSIFSNTAAWGYLRPVFCQHGELRNERVRRRSDAKIAILHGEGKHVFRLERGRVFN